MSTSELKRTNSSHDLRLFAAANNLRVKEAADSHMHNNVANLEDICRRQAFASILGRENAAKWAKPLTGWKKYLGEKWWYGLDMRERNDMREMVRDEMEETERKKREELHAFNAQLEELMHEHSLSKREFADAHLTAHGPGRKARIYGQLAATSRF